MPTRRSLAALAVSFATAWWTVITFREGGRWAAPVLSFSILGALIVISWLPRFRAFAVGPTVFAAAALAFVAAEIAVATGGGRSWWWDIDLDRLIKLTVFLLAVIFEIAFPSPVGARVHPSSAVAAAAFMIIPTFGTDITTSYHSATPSLAAMLLVALAPGAWLADSKRVLNQLLRLIEPTIVILLGWSAATQAPHSYFVGTSDLHWLLPLFAFPATVAAVCGVGKYAGWRFSARLPA